MKVRLLLAASERGPQKRIVFGEKVLVRLQLGRKRKGPPKTDRFWGKEEG
ncbi:MAG: hypothetical protein KGQ49_05305 [Verrucomicrobia bacterium]|nr:hypothetical protein [Verrucomicrobiota bacterium]